MTREQHEHIASHYRRLAMHEVARGHRRLAAHYFERAHAHEAKAIPLIAGAPTPRTGLALSAA